MPVRTLRSALLCALVALALPAGAAAQRLTAADGSQPPPDEVNAAIRAGLGADSVTVTAGGTMLDFWWADLAEDAWEALPEGTVVGAMRVTGAFKEIRGKVVAPGVYTLRYGLQPQNGDHLGLAENREFLLVSPAASDTSDAPLDFDAAVAIARLTTGTSHPASLSLNPPVATDAPLTAYTADPDLHGMVFAAGKLRFGLILLGIIEH